jgi:uncharacterized membrane protein (UPF0127 family)
MNTEFNRIEKTLKIVIGAGLLGLFTTAILWGVIAGINNENIQQKPIDNSVKVSYIDDQGDRHILNLELADTPQKRAFGLMNRTYLEGDSGMLFVFPDSQPLQFWMKDTLVSLDIIFLSSELVVNTIHEYTLVNQTTVQYPSKLPSKFVIEVNAGWSDRVGLQENDQFFIE